MTLIVSPELDAANELIPAPVSAQAIPEIPNSLGKENQNI